MAVHFTKELRKVANRQFRNHGSVSSGSRGRHNPNPTKRPAPRISGPLTGTANRITAWVRCLLAREDGRRQRIHAGDFPEGYADGTPSMEGCLSKAISTGSGKPTFSQADRICSSISAWRSTPTFFRCRSRTSGVTVLQKVLERTYLAGSSDLTDALSVGESVSSKAR